jgi:DNA-directed RNA polymerase subunit H (RpoH/RPB5)
MMQARGYIIPDLEREQLDNRDETNFVERMKVEKNRLALNSIYEPKPGLKINRPRIYLFYILRMSTKESEASLRNQINTQLELYSKLQPGTLPTESSILNYILITTEPQKIQKIIENTRPEIRVQIFDWKKFRYDLPSHVRVPPHELISNDEKDILLSTLKVESHRLPNMLISDAIAQYYDAIGHQIFLIRRRNQVGNVLRKEILYYRHVIDPFINVAEEEEIEEGINDYDLEQPDQL